MRKLRRLRDRVGYGDGHFTQLATGHDFFNAAWGLLDQLSGRDLQETLVDMVQCYRQHETEVWAECAPNRPWFADYQGNPQKLIGEVCAQREYAQRYPHGDRCKCPQCLLPT